VRESVQNVVNRRVLLGRKSETLSIVFHNLPLIRQASVRFGS
jgi:hypothetical protein